MRSCDEIMTLDLRTIDSDASVLEAAQMMRDNSVGFLPICDPQTRRLIAVVTDRDLVTRLCASDKRASETYVLEVATGGPVCCYEGTDLKVVEEAMDYYQVSRLVVVDEDRRPVGVVSLTDILMKERRGPALRTARGVLRREADSPQLPAEGVQLTPSRGVTTASAEPSQPSAEELYHRSGPASSREDYIVGGQETRAIKEFPR
jgi:CBS domain-containing protein